MTINTSPIFWTRFSLLGIIIAVSATNTYSAPLFKLDFESGLPDPIDTPLPVWALPARMATATSPGNLYELTNTIAHSGTSSLKLNPNGRNGRCNTCGGKLLLHNSNAAPGGDKYFVTDTQEDLTLSANKGPAAKKGRLLYNETKGFSKWEIISVEDENATNDKLIVKLLNPGINKDPAIFNANDNIYIARQCGVDGNFTSNVNQRDDCNILINSLENVVGTQAPGQSIYRRFYMRMDMAKPANMKLRYWSSNINDYANLTQMYFDATGFGDKYPVVPLVITFNVETITTNIKPDGKTTVYQPGPNPSDMPEGLNFERGKWYYIEEEFLAATLDQADTSGKTYNNDGEYRLWISESGKEDTDGATPIVEIIKMKLPVVERASFWGNFQHVSHTIGQIYIDDFEIASDNKIGAKISDHANVYPPIPPLTTN
ncbi:MAG: hypothetical protein OEY66_02245 [Gammaproteobacteria bacterium]|nr:hypothetical protein [Gammaproteobacteria bacterium]